MSLANRLLLRATLSVITHMSHHQKSSTSLQLQTAAVAQLQTAAAHVICLPAAFTVTHQQHVIIVQTTPIAALAAPEAGAIKYLEPGHV